MIHPEHCKPGLEVWYQPSHGVRFRGIVAAEPWQIGAGWVTRLDVGRDYGLWRGGYGRVVAEAALDRLFRVEDESRDGRLFRAALSVSDVFSSTEPLVLAESGLELEKRVVKLRAVLGEACAARAHGGSTCSVCGCPIAGPERTCPECRTGDASEGGRR